MSGETRPLCGCHGESMVIARRHSDGRTNWRCAVKRREYQQNQSRKPTEKGRFRAKTLSYYGLTPETYDEMLASQGGVCAICKMPPKEGGNSMAVDHDHTTGEVRGILHIHCNSGLGWYEANSDEVRKYLER